ncbi:MAG: DUF6580 family putative transport protein [Thermoplasmatota archaeon]
MHDTQKKILIAGLLVAAGVIGRILLSQMLPHAPHATMTLNGITQPVFMLDMFFVVGAIALFSGILLGGMYSIAVPLAVMAITDLYHGNTSIFLFTWTGFAFIGLLGATARRHGLTRSPLGIAGLGIGGVLLYDAWTNLGCWLGWYPHGMAGLATCYTMALPFTLWHLLSTTMAVAALSIPLLWYTSEKNRTMERSYSPAGRYAVMGACAVMAAASFALLP